jgi:hypothetical protein
MVSNRAEDEMVTELVLVHAGPNSPQKIAFDLMERVAFIEGKRIGRDQEQRTRTDRAWLLDAFSECLEAVQGRRPSTILQSPAEQ